MSTYYSQVTFMGSKPLDSDHLKKIISQLASYLRTIFSFKPWILCLWFWTCTTYCSFITTTSFRWWSIFSWRRGSLSRLLWTSVNNLFYTHCWNNWTCNYSIEASFTSMIFLLLNFLKLLLSPFVGLAQFECPFLSSYFFVTLNFN